MKTRTRAYNSIYTGEHLNRVAFPLGGIGAGMICLEGTGALSHVSLRGHPDIYNEPLIFSALCVKGAPNVARVLEGPVPSWKVFFPWGEQHRGSGGGGRDKTYGFPHCAQAKFQARFPFGTVTLGDPGLPLESEITGWSPFIPGDADSSSLPIAALEYRFKNVTDQDVEAVYSFHAQNFMSAPTPGAGVGVTPGGFVLSQPGSETRPWDQGAFSAAVDYPDVKVNPAWFRGDWWDALTMLWKSIREGATPQAEPIAADDPDHASPGGSLYVPLRLAPGEEKVIRLHLAWYVPETDLRVGKDPAGAESCGCRGDRVPPRYRPWYASLFDGIAAVTDYWRQHYVPLRAQSTAFSDCFYDTTLPPEVIEAVAANLTILKSPTLLRQTDGAYGAGKAALTWEGAVPGRARMCGTMPRRCRTSSRAWSAVCARPSSTRARTNADTRSFAPVSPCVPPFTTFTPPPTVSLAGS